MEHINNGRLLCISLHAVHNLKGKMVSKFPKYRAEHFEIKVAILTYTCKGEGDLERMVMVLGEEQGLSQDF